MFFALFAVPLQSKVIKLKDLKEKERKGSLVYKARVDKLPSSRFNEF